LEGVNALQLRVFRKEISQRQAAASLRAFDGDLRSGTFLRKELPAAAFERARKLSRENTARLGTRSADLLHVAVALELRATALYSFDLRQRKVAVGAGLTLNSLP
jgi:predicted nucleic acid-binding protein